MRHEELREFFANLTSEIFYGVEIESIHQSLEGESFVNTSTTTDKDTRLDIKANDLRGSRFSRTLLDVKVFNSQAKTSRRLLDDAYKYRVSLYQQRFYKSIRAASVSLFGCTGGAAPAATRTM